MAKFFWFFVGVVALLSFISGIGNSASLLDNLSFILWCSWAPLLIAAIYQIFGHQSVLLQYILSFAFIGVTLFACDILSMTTHVVLTSGPLNESGLIFIVMPFGFVKYGVYGGLLGSAIYFALWLWRKNA